MTEERDKREKKRKIEEWRSGDAAQEIREGREIHKEEDEKRWTRREQRLEEEIRQEVEKRGGGQVRNEKTRRTAVMKEE